MPKKDAKRDSRHDKRISLAPLDFEQALGGILKAGPHPKDDDSAPAEDKEKAPPKRRRKSRGSGSDRGQSGLQT